MADSLRNTLMLRDGLSESEVDEMIKSAKDDLMERLADGEMPDDICEEYFGLEPDYLEELINELV